MGNTTCKQKKKNRVMLNGDSNENGIKINRSNAPTNVNPVGGGGVRVRGRDLMPETIPLSGFEPCEATPGSGHLNLTDRSLVSIQKRLPSPSLEAF